MNISLSLPQTPPGRTPADEFGMPFHLVYCKEDNVPIDMVDIRDEEIYRLWISC